MRYYRLLYADPNLSREISIYQNYIYNVRFIRAPDYVYNSLRMQNSSLGTGSIRDVWSTEPYFRTSD